MKPLWVANFFREAAKFSLRAYSMAAACAWLGGSGGCPAKAAKKNKMNIRPLWTTRNSHWLWPAQDEKSNTSILIQGMIRSASGQDLAIICILSVFKLFCYRAPGGQGGQGSQIYLGGSHEPLLVIYNTGWSTQKGMLRFQGPGA